MKNAKHAAQDAMEPGRPPGQTGMRVFKKLAIFFACLAVLPVTRAEEHSSTPREKQLGTDGAVNGQFHQVVKTPDSPVLEFPGFLIGVEKSATIGAPRPERYHLEAREFAPYRSRLVRLLNDKKRAFVSHIVRYQLGEPRRKYQFVYNAYDTAWDPGSGYSKAESTAIPQLASELAKALETVRPTHVLVFSMGWNNDQNDAITRTNEIVKSLSECAKNSMPAPFQPLTILITWPSKWSVDVERLRDKARLVASYGVKANDADEIGLIWGNHLLHDVIEPLLAKHPAKLVLIGHSFGARLLTRAMFSRPLLKRDTQEQGSTPVDVAIAVQGAFSIWRFLPESEEGSPYRNFQKLDACFVLTTSRHDDKLPWARWVTGADHAGGKEAWSVACQRPDCFECVAVKEDGTFEAGPGGKRILCLEASAVVKGHGGKDLWRAPTYEMLWAVIRRYSYP